MEKDITSGVQSVIWRGWVLKIAILKVKDVYALSHMSGNTGLRGLIPRRPIRTVYQAMFSRSNL